ncbi:leucyl aminopeptidase [Planktotalea sp.]|uniref:leucyl aminopeptidase n=1 Tax=Planktotalea sp. TaxID=2029877 RepID=UPI0025EEF332|nr:leucyl aminopeptidase [Planktotalea sp.]
MPNLIATTFAAVDLDALAGFEGRIALVIAQDGKLDSGARRVNRLTKGAVARVIETGELEGASAGKVMTLTYPTGMAAQAIDILCLDRRPSVLDARAAGAGLGKAMGEGAALLIAESNTKIAQIVLGAAMRAYEFTPHKTKENDKSRSLTVMCAKPEEVAPEVATLMTIAEGSHMTRDLVNEPANVLTTTEFADRLKEMESLGLDVEILEEADLEKLGMRTLLCVGQGSDSPSKVVVMRWNGGEKDTAPLALVGKGVVFDTGGISLKPGAGMEDMTMDMGGAGVVSGVMRTLALRKAKANVVGLVGIVENMPSSNAVRPGDVIRSMKGDTVEVINTDAEGRLVLCDVMWYAQERFKPLGMIDLATLTGAIIVGLGHENAGVFSNNDALCDAFLKAAEAEGEGAWRMPLGKAYDDLLKSRIADMKNIGGRAAGSVTAAQFLQRFVKDETPWIHLDIAGVASVKSETRLAPVGATGWGVMALNRLVHDMFES